MSAIDNSLLLLYKPSGISSFWAVKKVKDRLGVKKAGHAGTLDPCAEGLLIIALGKATRTLSYIIGQDKHYEVYANLGIRTATGDREGAVVERQDFVIPQAQTLNRIFSDFSGQIEQTPPMYSALKHHGQRLYKLARANVSVPRKKRTVYIQSLTLKQIDADGFSFAVQCSKGTYIRTLVEDIAKALGTVAYTGKLKRTAIGTFNIKSAISLDDLPPNPPAKSQYLIKSDRIYANYDAYVMDASAERCFRHGLYTQGLPSGGCFRLYNESGDFLGVGGDSKVQVRFI